jgi:diguanylate cyclase (GGDEF)-like protein
VQKAIILFAMFSGCALGVWAASPGPLTTLSAVAALTNAQASQHIPVSFEATVIYYFRPGLDMVVQDGNVGSFVRTATDFSVSPGDRVLVEGTTEQSFLPFVEDARIKFLRRGTLPESVPARFDDLVQTHLNCRLVRVSGMIRAADIVVAQGEPTERLQMLVDGGYVELDVAHYEPGALRNLLDAEVEVVGAAARIFDGKMQQTGVKLKVSSLADIRVLRRAAVDPWALPITPLGAVIRAYHDRDLSHRIRVHGTVTYYLPGTAAVLENDLGSLWIATQSEEPLQIGDKADAIGFPSTGDNRLSLVHAEIRDSHVQTPIRPQEYSWSQLALWARNLPGGHQYDLVSIQGRVVAEVREAAQDDYILATGGRLFTAIYSHPPPPRLLPSMMQVPIGSTIRVTGICVGVSSTPFNGEAPFNILIRNFDDIAIVARAPWLNVRHLVVLVGLLLSVLIAIAVRSWLLERRIRHKTAALAYLERRRSRILEAINSSRPLSEILEQITEVVSFRLHGAACWCEIADGARLGKRPLKVTSQRIIQHEIPGRSGAVLGTIYAAIHRLNRPHREESEALSFGVGLAALAIETSRLYSDLVHRSEFDLLTDVPNRFSLEKQLEALIHDASQFAGVFGLIFVDLDRFKQVNDQYGHQVGDMYLQQAALRMKHQLRPADTLARLGGDEFAVVVPAVRNRDDVEEIALRLERCFDEPFSVVGSEVHGSASVGIALYPEDASTADALLSRADAAMYVIKQGRHRDGQAPAVGSAPNLAHCA